MKMKSLLLAIAGFALMSMQAYAQNVATPTAGATAVEATNSDYVTIGSRLPYFVTPDATISAMTTLGTMKASIFKWIVTASDGTTPIVIPFKNYAGTADAKQWDDFRTPSTTSGYFDNEISVEWTASKFAAGTEYQIQTKEKAVTLSSTIAGCEDADAEVKKVFVLARPTVSFIGSEGGGCSIAPGNTFYIPLTIVGLGDWDVDYEVQYNGTGGYIAQTKYRLLRAGQTVDDADVLTKSDDALVALGSVISGTATSTGNEGLGYTLPASKYGYYDVRITNITDRISRKSLTALTESGTGTTPYRIYVNPVPTTQSIQHIKNL